MNRTILAINILRTLGIAVAAFGFISVSTVYAVEGHDMSVSDVLDSIATTQGVTNERDIVCEEVSDEDLELLGDALMQRRIGDEELHTQMDNMMGGEGSETLTAMHEHLARMYLGCSDSGFGMGMMMGGGMMRSMMGGGPVGMMGGGMMQQRGFGSDRGWGANNNNTFGSMMGFNTMGLGTSWFGGLVMIAFWILVVIGIALLIQKFTMRDNTRDSDRHAEGSALDILKERYARGEIDKKEFEEKKKDIA